jgi:hypothetical protein
MFFLREYNVRQQRKKIYYGTAQKNPSATWKGHVVFSVFSVNALLYYLQNSHSAANVPIKSSSLAANVNVEFVFYQSSVIMCIVSCGWCKSVRFYYVPLAFYIPKMLLWNICCQINKIFSGYQPCQRTKTCWCLKDHL